MNDYIKKILSDGLGLQGDECEIERSHRSGGPRPGGDQPPRMILERFVCYTAQQKVLAAAKKESGIEWENCTLSIYEDMTKERSLLRRQFSPIMIISAVGASGETHPSTPGHSKILVEEEEMELH